MICTGLAVLFNRRANIFLSCRYFCRHSRPDVKCWNARGSAELGGGWRGQWFCVGVWWPHLLLAASPGQHPSHVSRVTWPGHSTPAAAASPAQPVSRLLVCSRTVEVSAGTQITNCSSHTFLRPRPGWEAACAQDFHLPPHTEIINTGIGHEQRSRTAFLHWRISSEWGTVLQRTLLNWCLFGL